MVIFEMRWRIIKLFNPLLLKHKSIQIIIKKFLSKIIWRPTNLSELTPNRISLGLTHLGMEASIYETIFEAFIVSLISCTKIV